MEFKTFFNFYNQAQKQLKTQITRIKQQNEKTNRELGHDNSLARKIKDKKPFNEYLKDLGKVKFKLIN